MKNRKRRVWFGVIIVLLLLLLILKSCTASKRNESKIDDDIYESLNKQEIEVINDTKSPVIVDSIDEYRDIISQLDDLGNNVTNNIIDELNKGDGTHLNEVTFKCDEDTAKVYELYSRMFGILSDSYHNLGYKGNDTYGEFEYVNTKFTYYDEMSRVLERISKSIRDKKVDDVLLGFDEIAKVLGDLLKQGGSRDENL